MIQTKIISCILCFSLLVSAVVAQDVQPFDSDHLKKKIEELESAAPKSGSTSVYLIYKRTLLRRYDQYISSLQQDIEDLRKIRATLDKTDLDGIKEIDANIERLIKEHEAAVEKARALRAETQGGVTTQPTSRPTPPLEVSQLPCPCEQIEKDKLPAGAIWCEDTAATDHKLNVQDLAERAAPILWFSPDEPLIKAGKQIPELLPGDYAADSAVVYYRISNLVLDPSIPISDKDQGFMFKHSSDFKLREIRGLTLKYYFYYSEDTGFNGHRHDLESVTFDIHFTLRRKDTGKEITSASEARGVGSYYVAHISRIVGAAHDVSWFYNQLDMEKDTSLPITLLVEEGKHATSPDRNADGFYSPGYDVNRRFNDAWGVRDIIGTGELGGVSYEGSMTKPRRPANMIMVDPIEAKRECLLSFYSGANKEKLESSQANNKVYKLRRVEPGLVTRVKQRLEIEKRDPMEIEKREPNQKNLDLTSIMKREKFEQDEPSKTHQASIFERAMKFGLGIEHSEDAPEALTLSYRYDGGHGFTFSPPIGRFQLPVFGGYVLPKANLILYGKDKRYSLEAMYTPSAARSFDWYASIGSEWFRPEGRDFDAKFVSEGGIKFRFPKKKLFNVPLGLRMFGARLGLRTTGRDPRVVFEFGAGAF